MLIIALLTLLHVLVFVYWLGGDLGAFYASRYLTKPDVPADRRLFAAKMVGDVDMAPRTALILMLPTGLLLARHVGWITLPWIWVVLISALFLLWLGLAWYLHLAHAHAPKPARSLDLGIRWLVLVGLVLGGTATLSGWTNWPLFLGFKCLLLALAILLGLIIRQVLTPLGPALAGLGGDNASRHEARLAQTLKKARPLVMLIWVTLIAAALLGLWKPV